MTVPSFRVDVTREVDLIEEVGRHYGFDRLPVRFPPLATHQPPPDPRIARDRLVRLVLTAAGFSESMTFAFIEKPAALPFCEPGVEPAAIANPLSEKFAVLRPSLLPGLVDSCAHNRRRGRKDVRLFETGSRFTPAGEGRAAAFAWSGAASEPHWSAPARAVDFFDVKGAVELLCSAFGVSAPDFVASGCPYLVRGRAADVRAGGTRLGVVGQLVPAIARRGVSRRVKRSTSRRSIGCARRPRGAGRPARRIAAAVPVDRARPLDPRRRRLACCCRSWHYPFGGAGDARIDRRVRSVSGQGRSGRPCQPVAAPDVPLGGAHADGRRSAGGDGADRRRAPRTAHGAERR